MRTTIRLDDELLKAATRHAAESGCTLTAVIEEALREKLLRNRSKSGRAGRIRLKTTGTGGIQPGVELNDSAALLGAMEEHY
jgi:hypothetical protein